jgi:hypothetical protein
VSLSLPFFHAAPKIQPRHDPWPPTWRLPSGAIQVEATYKEPARQKLVDKSTRVVAFLALMFTVLSYDRWPFPEASTWILQAIAADGPAALPELLAARAIIGLLAVVGIVGSYRLALAALGLDLGRATVTFEHKCIRINGQVYNRDLVHGFELEPHPLARQEEHRDRQQQIASPLYFRDAYIMILQYGDRRIEIAALLGRHPANQLLARLQTLLMRLTGAESDTNYWSAKRT